MNWEAIGAVGETLGALAVFGSLIYLAFEVRQNSRNIQSQSINSQADQLQKFAAIQAVPEVMAAMKKIYVDKEAEPDFESAALLEAYYLSGLSVAQAQFRHKALGLDSDWAPYARLVRSMFATQYVKAWWAEIGSSIFGEDFVLEVNRIIAEVSEDDFWLRYGNGTRLQDDG
jgi:hypothetical protein